MIFCSQSLCVQVGVCDPVWKMIQQHLHVNKFVSTTKRWILICFECVLNLVSFSQKKHGSPLPCSHCGPLQLSTSPPSWAIDGSWAQWHPRQMGSGTTSWLLMMENSMYLCNAFYSCTTSTRGKAGKAQSLRIPQTVWDLEVDLACLAGHVLDAMSSYRNPENLLVFDEAVIKAAMTNFIEGTLWWYSKVFYYKDVWPKDPRYSIFVSVTIPRYLVFRFI